MDLFIIEMAATATIAITVFGIAFCLLQTRYCRVNRSLSVFLAAIAVNNVPTALNRYFEDEGSFFVQVAEVVLWSPSNLCLAPLFWLYVYTLTSKAQRRPARLYRHFVLPALAMLVGVAIAVGPQEVRTALIPNDTLPTSIGAIVLIAAFAVLQLLLFPQMAVYLFLILRRLLQYRRLLRDVYASTEEHELRWIYAIGGFGVLFWGTHTAILVLAFEASAATAPPAFSNLASLTGLALVATTTLWGVRQRPPLVPVPTDTPPSGGADSQKAKKNAEQGKAEKYEKSALNSETATRLSRKLRDAMETDHLHRDPNLSLWVLARHTGASPNYISQTLNEVIGESFFDFVNGYRIAEAKARLSSTNDTILNITYDVGFNARSSFYNAFKRVTGQTPSSFRKTMSCPVGMDDKTANPRDI
ncbi:AraC family transcriptional regulator [uncultured Litoreibacter sp.]|uniref:helix-turn-helix domain-containing protein n=1 Tax=uncultured Litoreibacter sp. TaxID=1392394 RepID=UPI002616EDCB|nr:AraC family transcriptional regulator [uncultured Litoreibacter sp.]